MIINDHIPLIVVVLLVLPLLVWRLYQRRQAEQERQRLWEQYISEERKKGSLYVTTAGFDKWREIQHFRYGKSKFYWHWQNLNEDSKGKIKGSGLYEGRAWFQWQHHGLNLEWAVGRRASHTGAYVAKDCGDGYKLVFHFAQWHVFHIFITITGLRWLLRYQGWEDSHKELGWRWHHHALWVNLWNNPNVWRRGDWREFSIQFDRLLFGDYSTTVQNETDWQDFTVDMPEGAYRARVKFYDRVGTWERFKRPKVRHSGEIELIDPIYFAGDGDNDYDLEDDYFSSIGIGDLQTVDSARQYVWERVMEMRKRNGLPQSIYNDPVAREQNELFLQNLSAVD